MTGTDGHTAGVVLAGGRSSRMGTPKAALEWHGSTLLYRTAALVARAAKGPVVVVGAARQALPRLPPGIEVVDDPAEGLGPMQGLAAGLAAVAGRAHSAFVCSTDLPFLHPAFVVAVLGRFDLDAGAEIVLPVARGFRQPLAAGYRTGLLGAVEARLAAGDLRLGMLLPHCRVVELSDADLLDDPALARADPALDSLVNLNEPGDYADARARPAPEVVVECFGALAVERGRGPRTVRAATLAAAASSAGVELGDYVLAALNGDQITRDPELPLVAGDAVSFLSADGGG